MTEYYFEVLPLHPLPEPQESLSSYVNRLMYLNRLTRNDFAHLVRCKSIFWNTVAVDYGVGMFEALSSITSHSREQLARTTLEGFMATFAKITEKKEIKGFLKDVLVRYQRYCPACLREKPVYKLPWRFNSLRYCVDHGCQLCDTCGYCGSHIEFLRSENGTCPTCGIHLGSCEIIKADADELRKDKRTWDSILYLLAQSEHPDYSLRLHLFRQVLRTLLQNRGLSIAGSKIYYSSKLREVCTNTEDKPMPDREKYKQFEAFSALFGYTIADIFRMIDQFFVFENQRYYFSRLALILAYPEYPWQVYMIAQKLESIGAKYTEENFKSSLGIEYSSVLADPIAAMLMDKYTGRWPS